MNSRSFFFTLLRVNGFMKKVMLPFALIALVIDILAILRKEFGARYNLLIRTAFSPDLKSFACRQNENPKIRWFMNLAAVE